MGNEAPEPTPILLPRVKKTQQIKFAKNLAVGRGVIIYENSPFDGYIKQVTPHWPGGCKALVDIAVGHGNTQFCPLGSGEYLALDGVTPTYPSQLTVFNEEVKLDEEIWVKMRNRDSVNTHNITVTASIEEK